MSLNRLTAFLDGHEVPYEKICHQPAFTARRLAAVAKVPQWDLAKTVVVKLDGRVALAIVPASRNLQLDYLQRATGADDVRLLTEAEFAPLFPDAEVGAMPPFGNLYGFPVYADETLADEEFIAFNAGTHTDAIRMRFYDFARLTGAKLAEISCSFAPPASAVCSSPPAALRNRRRKVRARKR